MATVTNNNLTLIELAHRIEPRGALATIAEVLTEENEILADAPWVEANDTFSNKSVRRLSQPAGSARKLNEGVSREASRTIEVIDTIMMLESYSETDKKLVEASPNPKAFRMGEARAFIEGMSQTLADKLMYGNANTTPEDLHGLAPRMASLATTTNVLNAGGSGSDLTSVFVVQWGVNSAFFVYPKGAPKLGISHTDLGEVTAEDANGAFFQAYRDHFRVEAGLCVKDDRCIGRIANIESTGTSNLFDEDDLIRLLNRMPRSGKGAAIYVNDTVMTQMEIQLKDKNNVYYTPGKGEGLAGTPMLYFRGNPVRKVDAITITETALT
jgi:hypothetical protein